MQRILADAVNPFESDSIEGFVESVYFKGEMNVAVTSTWCPDRHTQVPVLITILMNKTTGSYAIHFKQFFKIYGALHETIEAFLSNFPGNTCDFADALKNGFFQAANAYCLKKYGRKLTDEEMLQMYRYCLVHFERNLCRVANISIAVDRNTREEFKDMARNLITILTFNDFACEVKSILKQFTLLASWFKW